MIREYVYLLIYYCVQYQHNNHREDSEIYTVKFSPNDEYVAVGCGNAKIQVSTFANISLCKVPPIDPKMEPRSTQREPTNSYKLYPHQPTSKFLAHASASARTQQRIGTTTC